MYITTIVSPEKFEKWNKFITNHPHNTIFQSPEMYSFYEKVNNFTPYVFIAEEENKIKGVLLAVLIKEGKGIKGYFSSRVVVYGGPLISIDKNIEVLEVLLKELVNRLKRKSIFIQFRNFFEWKEKEKSVFAKYGFIFRDRLNLIVSTKDKKEALKNISESRRRQIRLGLKNNAKTEKPKNIKEVEQFYILLVHLYKEKVKKPLPDWSFFNAFYQESKKGNLGVIRLVKSADNKVIGGILAPVTPGLTVYEWYVVGMDKEFKKSYPSILATWSAIQFALENNFLYFDFMGLGVPHKEYGVRDFKSKFGGQGVNYGRFARRNNKFFYLVAEMGYNLLRQIN